MLRKSLWIGVVTMFLALQTLVGRAWASDLDPLTRTVPANDQGQTLVLSLQQVKQGKRLFNYACAQCHAGGVTKTDPNIGLDPEALSLATPRRDNIQALVNYMENPTTYDGMTSIAELHPSLKSTDIFPKMRNLTQDDLVAIAGHILLQPKVVGEQWGGGKVYR